MNTIKLLSYETGRSKTSLGIQGVMFTSLNKLNGVTISLFGQIGLVLHSSLLGTWVFFFFAYPLKSLCILNPV